MNLENAIMNYGAAMNDENGNACSQEIVLERCDDGMF